MLNVETIRKVRQAHFREGKSIREITRELKIARNTVRNIIRSGILISAVILFSHGAVITCPPHPADHCFYDTFILLFSA